MNAALQAFERMERALEISFHDWVVETKQVTEECARTCWVAGELRHIHFHDGMIRFHAEGEDDQITVHWLHGWWTMTDHENPWFMEAIIQSVEIMLAYHDNDPVRLFQDLPRIEDTAQFQLDRLALPINLESTPDAIIEYRCKGCPERGPEPHWHIVDANAHSALLARHVASYHAGMSRVENQEEVVRVTELTNAGEDNAS